MTFCFVVVRLVSLQRYTPYHNVFRAGGSWVLQTMTNKKLPLPQYGWSASWHSVKEGVTSNSLITSINPFNGTYYCSLWWCPYDHCASYTGAFVESHMMHWWFPTTWELGCSWRVLRWTFFSIYCHGFDRHTRKSDAWTERGHQPWRVKGNTINNRP